MELFRTEDGLVKLRGDLHISNAEDLRKALIVELASTSALVLELSEVDSCDSASLQLLCSLKKSAEACGKVVSVTGQSTAMVDTCSMIGFPLKDLTNAPNN